MLAIDPGASGSSLLVAFSLFTNVRVYWQADALRLTPRVSNFSFVKEHLQADAPRLKSRAPSFLALFEYDYPGVLSMEGPVIVSASVKGLWHPI